MSELLNYRPSDSAIYYTPDRPVEPRRMVVGLLIAMGLATIGGIAYARVLPTIDLLLGRMAAVGVAALAVGLLGLIPVKRGRVHVPVLAAGLGGFLSVYTLYVIWLTWVDDRVAHSRAAISLFTLITRPLLLAKLIVLIGKYGTWSSHNRVIHGPVLYFYWMVEAAAILGVGTLIPARSKPSNDPRCKSCGSTCARVPNFPRFSVARQPEFLSAVEGRQFDLLAHHAPPENENAPELSVKLLTCPKCRATNVLTISWVGWQRGKNGRPVVKIVPLINQLLVTPDEADRVTQVMTAVRDQRVGASENPKSLEVDVAKSAAVPTDRT